MKKVIQIGSSAGITLPKAWLQKHRVKVGDPLLVREQKDKLVIEFTDDLKVEDELLKWTDGFIDEYRDALEELADK